jgi:hypothetical protein
MVRKVIEQLEESVYKKLITELEETKASKMLTLLGMYRDGTPENEITATKLGVSAASFYTLKSRLQDKVQKALFRSASDDFADLLKNLSSIPYLVNNTPRESAVLLLLFLEKELKEKDKPGELAQVYGALKKLHAHHTDYYHYEQLYNKNIAYFLAFEKSEEVLTGFTRTLGEYLMGGELQLKEVMKLYIKELTNVSRMYESHRIRMCKSVAEVSYALFVENAVELSGSDKSVQDVLDEMSAVLSRHPDDAQYRFLKDIHNFLSFEFYSLIGLHKNAREPFEAIINDKCRLLYRSHTAVVSLFLISAFHKLKAVQDIQISSEEWPIEDAQNTFGVVNRALFNAGILFDSLRYAEAASVLNDCLNDVTFRNLIHAECSVRILYILCLIGAEKTDLAETQLRSLSRKLAGLNPKPELAPGTNEWLNLLKAFIAAKDKSQMKKAVEAVKAELKNRNALLRFMDVESKAMTGIMR